MKKTKRILISLLVFWLVCYALMFLLNGMVFASPSPDAGNFSNLPVVNPSKTTYMVSLSSIAVQIPSKDQAKKVDRFTQPVLAATLVTALAGLAVACGYQLVQLGCRGNPPITK